MSLWRIYPVYQPVVSLQDGNIFGFEALTRDESPHAVSPETLFENARITGQLFHLEMLSRRLAIEFHPPLEDNHKLFLNVAPDILMDENYQQGLTLKELADHQIPPEAVVLEITEQFKVYDPAALNRVMIHYQTQGFSVAMDDFGAGYANLNLLAEIAPQFLKLDRKLVCDIGLKPRSQAIVHAIIAFAKDSHTSLIAEGIENLVDLQWLREAGVPLGQGYLLGRPKPVWGPESLDKISKKWDDVMNKPFVAV